jgi:hypothetical protein
MVLVGEFRSQGKRPKQRLEEMDRGLHTTTAAPCPGFVLSDASSYAGLSRLGYLWSASAGRGREAELLPAFMNDAQYYYASMVLKRLLRGHYLYYKNHLCMRV